MLIIFIPCQCHVLTLIMGHPCKICHDVWDEEPHLKAKIKSLINWARSLNRFVLNLFCRHVCEDHNDFHTTPHPIHKLGDASLDIEYDKHIRVGPRKGFDILDLDFWKRNFVGNEQPFFTPNCSRWRGKSF